MSDEKKPLSKSELTNQLATRMEMSKGDVSNFFDQLAELIGEQLQESGPGVLSIPGLMKVKVVRKPAQPEREGINPFTKEPTIFKAKPATNVVKISPLKALKDRVQPFE